MPVQVFTDNSVAWAFMSKQWANSRIAHWGLELMEYIPLLEIGIKKTTTLSDRCVLQRQKPKYLYNINKCE